MELYILWADTHEDSYGTDISLFAVCESEEKLEEAVNTLREKGLKYHYSSEKMELNKIKEIYLGGYTE